MGVGPSKEELEHEEYLERKRLERQREQNIHQQTMKGKLNLRMPTKSYFILRRPVAIESWLF